MMITFRLTMFFFCFTVMFFTGFIGNLAVIICEIIDTEQTETNWNWSETRAPSTDW